MPKSISDCLSVQCDWLYIDYSSSPVSQLLFTSLTTHKKGWKPVLTQHWKYFCLQFNKWTWLPSPLTNWDSCVAGRQLEPNQPLTQPFHKSYFQAVQSPTAPSLNKRFSCVTMITFINRSSKKKKKHFSYKSFHLKDKCNCCQNINAHIQNTYTWFRMKLPASGWMSVFVSGTNCKLFSLNCVDLSTV